MQLWKRNLIICWVGSFLTCCAICLVVPFLSTFIQQLGVKNTGTVSQLSGIAFGITFFTGALMSPFWGRLADKKGRKRVLMMTSLGLALVNLLFVATVNVYMLIALRALQGLVTGFMPAATSFVAKEMPEERIGSCLSVMTTGATAGSLLGPVIGGYLDEAVGIQNVFLIPSLMLFVCFLSVLIFLKERKEEVKTVEVQATAPPLPIWKQLKARYIILGVLITSCLINVANQSIEPIVTLYVRQLLQQTHSGTGHASLISGLVVSSTGVGILLSSYLLSRFIDRLDYIRILTFSVLGCALLFIPMALVKNVWALMALRFAFGTMQAAVVPTISTLLKKNSEPATLSRFFGYNQAFQYVGIVVGPQIGGFVSAYFGFSHIFFVTSAILLLNFGIIRFSAFKDRKKAISAAKASYPCQELQGNAE